MNHIDNLAMSRPLGVAESLIGGPADSAAILRRPVLLTGDPDALATINGQYCLLDCLRLLPRIAGPLVVALPVGLGEFEEEVRVLAATVYAQGAVSLEKVPISELDRFASVLNIGSSVRTDLPWTSVNSNGWLVRASSTNGPLPADMGEPNPIGALMAASIGVAEVFKRVYGIPAHKAPPLERTEFSLFELNDSPAGIGPSLPRDIELPDTMIVGAGAIGNGIALLLAQLACRGRIHFVDCQNFAEENLGTCVLLDDRAWIGESKASCLAHWLQARTPMAVTGEAARIEQARASTTVRSMAVELVLNGLDDVQARHDTQLMWPSTLVDGGINAVGAAVVTHRLDQSDAACLRCAFELPATNVRDVQQAASGLSTESLQDLSQPLSERDVELADETKRPWLHEMLAQGKTRCATVGAATSAQLGLDLSGGFRPSVPFIATAAAALVLAEAVKAVCYPEARFTHRFQVESLFRGPQASVSTYRGAAASCICVTNRDVIDTQVRVRHGRRQRL